jgi:hypothetical protein
MTKRTLADELRKRYAKAHGLPLRQVHAFRDKAGVLRIYIDYKALLEIIKRRTDLWRPSS